MQNPPDLVAATNRMVRSMVALGVVAALLIGVVVAVLTGPIDGLVVFAGMAGAWTWVVMARLRRSVERILGRTKATPIGDHDEPRWRNTVEGLCLTAGVSEPDLFVIDDPSANAAALADGTRSVVVATRGLLDAMTTVELEAVTANMLCRIKDGSSRYGTAGVALFDSGVASGGIRTKWFAAGIGPQRAVETDLEAVDLTRYPPGLATALTRIDAIGTQVPGVGGDTAHLWLAPVVELDREPQAAEPLSLRIAVLEEL